MAVQRSLLVGVFLTVASLFAAAAHAGTAVFAFSDQHTMAINLDGSVTGEDAANMRTQIDQNGDGDGTVTQQEVDAFETQFKDLINQYASSAVPGGHFTLDDKDPSKFEVTNFQLSGATGSSESQDPIGVQFAMEVTFPVPDASEHTLTVQAESNDNQSTSDYKVDSSTLTAPNGFGIQSTSGLPAGATVSKDKRSISFPGEVRPTGEMNVVFSTSAKKGTPGPSAILAALAAVGVALLRRR